MSPIYSAPHRWQGYRDILVWRISAIWDKVRKLGPRRSEGICWVLGVLDGTCRGSFTWPSDISWVTYPPVKLMAPWEGYILQQSVRPPRFVTLFRIFSLPYVSARDVSGRISGGCATSWGDTGFAAYYSAVLHTGNKTREINLLANDIWYAFPNSLCPLYNLWHLPFFFWRFASHQHPPPQDNVNLEFIVNRRSCAC